MYLIFSTSAVIKLLIALIAEPGLLSGHAL